MSSADATDEFDSVTQSRVPAAGAPPVATAAPNSVFALGQMAGNPEAAKSAQRIDLAEYEQSALDLLAVGACSNSALRAALGLKEQQTKRLMTRLRTAEKVVLLGHGTGARWALAGYKGLGWEAAQGKKTKAGPVARKSATPLKAKRPAKAVARAVAPVAPPAAPPAPAVAPEITCGLFSNGEIQIDIPDEQLRLNREQTRYLIDWLFKVDNVLREVRA